MLHVSPSGENKPFDTGSQIFRLRVLVRVTTQHVDSLCLQLRVHRGLNTSGTLKDIRAALPTERTGIKPEWCRQNSVCPQNCLFVLRKT